MQSESAHDIKTLHVLILGGEPEFNQMAESFEASRQGGHKLYFAGCISEGQRILSTVHID